MVEGGGLLFTVTLDQAVQDGFDVDITFINVNATGGATTLETPDDYDNGIRNLTFVGVAGETQQFTVSTLDDAVLEANETFSVQLTASNTLVNDSDTATGTIIDNDAAKVTVEDVMAVEGDGLLFTVTLDKAVQGAFDVAVSLSDLSATGGDVPLIAPEDYDNVTATLTFAGTAGETHQFTISTLDDAVLESTESFTLALDADNALVTDNDTATGTINDNDTAAVTVENVSAVEGGGLLFVVSLDKAVQGAFNVVVSLSDVSAIGGSAPVISPEDYNDGGQTLTFAGTAGESHQFTVNTLDDGILESTESFTVHLAADNALVTDSDTATGTITDNDAAQVTVADVTAVEGGGLLFTVTLDQAVQDAFTVDVSFNDMSAIGGAAPFERPVDYANSAVTLSFFGTAGETQQFTVNTHADAVVEANESFTVRLNSSNTLVSDGDTATGTITDDDAAQVTIEDVTAVEGGGLLFTVTLDEAVQDAFDVDVSLVSVSADGGVSPLVSPEDYDKGPVTLNFTGTAGEQQQFMVNTLDDAVLEGSETFNVQLAASNALVTDDDTATGTITDNDAAQVTMEDVTAVEGSGLLFTVRLDNAVQVPFAVNVSFTNVNATGGRKPLVMPTDYDNATVELNFAGTAGETQQFFIITADDAVLETSESFTARLDSSNALVTDDDTATGTITDNDSAEVTIEDVTAVEGSGLLFTVTLDHAVQESFAVVVSFANVSASGGATPLVTPTDFDNEAQTVTFLGTAGETQQFNVSTLNDSVVEGTETFSLHLAASNALVIDDDAATGTITDNDAAKVTVEDVTAAEGGGLLFTVTLDQAVQDSFTVNVSLSNVSAAGGAAPLMSPQDYVNDGQTLTFAGTKGETRRFTVSTLDDDVLESTETFTVQLAASNSLVTDSDAATGTITDNDTAQVTVADVTMVEGGVLLFTVTLDKAVQDPFDVAISFGDVSAAGGAAPLEYPEDYANNALTLSFVGTSGETRQFMVNTLDDAVLEGSETFTVHLAAGNALVTDDDTATGTITDNDSAEVTIEDVIAVEGGGLLFSVKLDRAVQAAFVVDVSFSDVSATGGATLAAPVDFIDTQVSLNFAGTAGEIQQFTVSTFDDAILEPGESFTVHLDSSHALVTDSDTATGTITDNDDARLTVEDVAGVEGSRLLFTVLLDKRTQEEFDVEVTFVDASARGGSMPLVSPADYANGSVTLHFSGTAGETRQFTVNTLDDELLEGDETFLVQLDATSNIVLDSDTAIGTITSPFDFGDAPNLSQSGFNNSYPTTISQNGARHAVSSGLRLGTAVDSELDGQPASEADADDIVGADEDGVQPIASLLATTDFATRSSFAVDVSDAGLLDAWVDFNRDGDWDDPDEQIALSVALPPGVHLLGFTVPAGATPGDTFARFRLSSQGGLSTTGAAADGEVEDYLITILDGDSGLAEVKVGLPASVEVDTDADGQDIVVRVEATELFRAPGARVARFRFVGNESEDVLNIANLSAAFTGPLVVVTGDGNDLLRLSGEDQIVDLSIVSSLDVQGVETIDIVGRGDNTLGFSAQDVVRVSSTGTLAIRANPGDAVNIGQGWTFQDAVFEDGVLVRILEQGDATIRMIGPYDWSNPANPLDVNASGSVEPLDALIVINELNSPQYSDSIRRLDDPATLSEFPRFFYDVNQDGFVAPIDALQVVNFLIARSTLPAGEASAIPSTIQRLPAIPTRAVVQTWLDPRRGGPSSRMNQLASPDLGEPFAKRGKTPAEDIPTKTNAKALDSVMADVLDWLETETPGHTLRPTRHAE
ncbi:MAG: GEVED domain-containing protein [Planctomycetota bacterium]|nr:GEVED domain-containing protein [Planctomycetota bacterium]